MNKDLEKVDKEVLETVDAKSIINSLDNLEKAESTGLSLVKEYLDLKKGEEKRFVVFAHGQKEDTDTDTGEISITPTVDLMDSKKQLHFTMSHVIVQSLANAKVGTGVSITYTGDKKLDKGRSLKEYSITLLNLQS